MEAAMYVTATRTAVLRVTETVLDRINRDSGVQFGVLDATVDPPLAPEVRAALRQSSSPDGLVVVTVALGSLPRGDVIGWARFSRSADLDPVWSIHALADQIHDTVLEATDGEPIPNCAGHPHPMQLTVSGSEVWWRCPATDADQGLRERLVC